ncbi:phage major capsid protein [Virgibacillus sp. CBA3643]|uniref:phage major capsid protein n=1 Tax=Virgibacillus sp. CBA3643 TaxID=2942278 RepID=UPI0035A30786
MSLLKNQAEGIIPIEYSKELVQGVVKGSSILTNSKMETMKANTRKLSKIQGVEAHMVEEAQEIPASNTKFPTLDLVGKKFAATQVVSHEMLEESLVDVLAEIQTEAVEQFYRGFDRYATQNILQAINGTGQKVQVGATAGQNLYEDISDTLSLVEGHGYTPGVFLANHTYKNDIRKLKDNNGNNLYSPTAAGTPDEFFGLDIAYNFGIDRTNTELITGDFKFSHVGIPNELRYTVMNQGTIDGVNLGQTDQVAIRLILTMAHVVSREDAFASLTPEADVEG